MEIINRSELLLAAVDAQCMTAMHNWLAVVEKARWQSFEDVRSTFARVEEKDGYLVFDCFLFQIRASIDYAARRLYLQQHHAIRGSKMITQSQQEYFDLVQTFPLVPIRSAEHLQSAVKFMAGLTRPDNSLSAGASDYLSVLGTLVAQFEQKTFPQEDLSPQEALRHLLLANNLSQADIVHLVGQKSNLSAFLSGKRDLSKQSALNLAGYFKVPPELFQRKGELAAWVDKRLATGVFGRELDLSGENITDSQIDDILMVSNLSRLNLSNTNIVDRQLAKLARLRNLRSLELASTGITDKGLVHIAQLRMLEALSLKNTQITDAGLEQIGKIATLTNVDLIGITFDGSGFKNLSQINQSWFWFGAAPFSAKALESVVDSRLKNVGFYFNCIDDEGVKILSKSKALYDLCLYCDISAKTIAGLTKCKSLKRLWLGSKTRLSDNDIEILAQMQQLEMLEISACDLITQAGAKKLQKLLPGQVVCRR